MITLKCGVCHAEVKLIDDHIAQCEVCQNLMLIPNVDDDVRNDMLNRGNYFRSNKEFDRAASSFEQIIARNDEDAEAHWNLVLARYGVDYVADPRSGIHKPTIHRNNKNSILDDVDYIAAMKYAPAQRRIQYEEQAMEINEIWKDYMEIARKEQPYDVFISYKESPGISTDPESRQAGSDRTEDSVIAQELYEDLTQRGLKVFLSRIVFASKLGEKYEPYIYAALQSSRVMLVVGTRRDYMEAVWVKNEWSRFLELRREDRTREIIPVIKHMDEYDLPEELEEFMPRNLERVGVKQDLIRGILKATGHADGNIEMLRNKNLAEVALKLLSEKKWNDAEEAAQQLLNKDSSSPEAYKVLFLAQNKCITLRECVKFEEDVQNMPAFVRMKNHANSQISAEIEEYIELRKLHKIYLEAKHKVELKNYEEAHQLFLQAGDYEDALELAASYAEKAEEQKRERIRKGNEKNCLEELNAIATQTRSGWGNANQEAGAFHARYIRVAGSKRNNPMDSSGLFYLYWAVGILIYALVTLVLQINNEDLEVEAFSVLIVLIFFWIVAGKLLSKYGEYMNGFLKFIIGNVGGLFASGAILVPVSKIAENLKNDLSEYVNYGIVFASVAALNFVVQSLIYITKLRQHVAAVNARAELEALCSQTIPGIIKDVFTKNTANVRAQYEELISAESYDAMFNKVMDQKLKISPDD